jgi:hypothetical protein
MVGLLEGQISAPHAGHLGIDLLAGSDKSEPPPDVPILAAIVSAGEVNVDDSRCHFLFRRRPSSCDTVIF